MFARVDKSHVVAIGPTAAILYARILWRSEQTGSWTASRTLLADETGLTEAMLRTAIKVLRDRGWVTASRVSVDDQTLVWTPVVAGQPANVDSSTSPTVESSTSHGRINTGPMDESSILSYETERLTPVAPQGASSAERRQPVTAATEPATSPEPPALFAEALEPNPKPKRSPRRKPQTELPKNFGPLPRHIQKAKELGIDLSIEGPRFVAHHQAKGNLFADWHRALDTWLLTQRKFDRLDAAKAAAAPVIDRRSSLNAQVGW